MKLLILIFFSLLLFSCKSSNYNDQPNRISRVDVLSKNKNQITISHSTRGKKIAFRFADEHCETFGKLLLGREQLSNLYRTLYLRGAVKTKI